MTIEQSSPPILRPLPRRPFAASSLLQQNTNTDETLGSRSPLGDETLLGGSARSQDDGVGDEEDESLHKSQSFINLTSSTLFGLYPDDTSARGSEPATPWGLGAETPAVRASIDGGRGNLTELHLPADRKDRLSANKTLASPYGKAVSTHNDTMTRSRRLALPLLLFILGIGYGQLVLHVSAKTFRFTTRLADTAGQNWLHSGLWGGLAASLGALLPLFDGSRRFHRGSSSTPSKVRRRSVTMPKPSISEDWASAIRNIGAFVGIAFLIRRMLLATPEHWILPWFVAAPILWYLLDGTSAGLVPCLLTSIAGTIAFLSTRLVLPPHQAGTADALRRGQARLDVASGSLHEELAVIAWLFSVVFCGCVLFGSVARSLGAARTSSRP